MPLSRNISLGFGGSSLIFCIIAFVWGFHARSEHNECEELIEKVEVSIRRGHYEHAIQMLSEKNEILKIDKANKGSMEKD